MLAERVSTDIEGNQYWLKVVEKDFQFKNLLCNATI